MAGITGCILLNAVVLMALMRPADLPMPTIPKPPMVVFDLSKPKPPPPAPPPEPVHIGKTKPDVVPMTRDKPVIAKTSTTAWSSGRRASRVRSSAARRSGISSTSLWFHRRCAPRRSARGRRAIGRRDQAAHPGRKLGQGRVGQAQLIEMGDGVKQVVSVRPPQAPRGGDDPRLVPAEGVAGGDALQDGAPADCEAHATLLETAVALADALQGLAQLLSARAELLARAGAGFVSLDLTRLGRPGSAASGRRR